MGKGKTLTAAEERALREDVAKANPFLQTTMTDNILSSGGAGTYNDAAAGAHFGAAQERRRQERIHREEWLKEKERQLEQLQREQERARMVLQEEINAENAKLAQAGLMRIPDAQAMLQENPVGQKMIEFIEKAETATRLNGPKSSLVTVKHEGRSYKLPRAHFQRLPLRPVLDEKGQVGQWFPKYKTVYHPILIKDNERLVTDDGWRFVPMDLMPTNDKAFLHHLSGLQLTSQIKDNTASAEDWEHGCLGAELFRNIETVLDRANDMIYKYYRKRQSLKYAFARRLEWYNCDSRSTWRVIMNKRLCEARVPVQLHWYPRDQDPNLPFSEALDEAEGGIPTRLFSSLCDARQPRYGNIILEHPCTNAGFKAWVKEKWQNVPSKPWSNHFTLREYLSSDGTQNTAYGRPIPDWVMRILKECGLD